MAVLEEALVDDDVVGKAQRPRMQREEEEVGRRSRSRRNSRGNSLKMAVDAPTYENRVSTGATMTSA